MPLIITSTVNGGLKIKSQDGSILKIFPDAIQISSFDDNKALLISTDDDDIPPMRVYISDITSIAGNAPGVTVEAVIDQINTALASVNQPVSGPLTDIQLRANPVITVPRSKVSVNSSGLSAANTDLLSGTVSGWYRVADLLSGSFQIIGGAGISAGAVIFEQTNDIVNAPNGSVMPVFEPNQNAAPYLTAISISANSTKLLTAPLTCEYIRVRISTAFVGGTVGIAADLSSQAFTNINPQVTQATPANLQILGTVAPLAAVTDIASAAITATATTSAVTPASGLSQEIILAVTAMSGTLPTLQVDVQESRDGGTNWETIYSFPTIGTVGVYRSDRLSLRGNRIRYVQTVAGSGSPSISRSITRNQLNESSNKLPLPFGLNNIGDVGAGEYMGFSPRAAQSVQMRRRVRQVILHKILATSLSTTYTNSAFIDVSNYNEAIVEVIGAGMTLSTGNGIKLLVNGQTLTFLPTQFTYPLPTTPNFAANPINMANPTLDGSNNGFFGAFYLPLFTDSISIALGMQAGAFSAGTISVIIKLKG